MVTVLNFLRQNLGGGVQNALSFIETLSTLDDPQNYQVFARQGSAIAKKSLEYGFDTCAVAGGTVAQLRFGTTCKHRFKPGQLCFTFFGPPWRSTQGHLLNVCGVAYSNLYYPEIEFWKQYRGLPRWKRELKDRLRLRGLSHADYWIFETETLAKRAVRLAHYPAERVGVVRMTASSLVCPERVQVACANAFDQQIPQGFRFLFLASAAPNKRIDRAAAIAARMKQLTDRPFVMVTTMPTDAPYFRQVAEAFQSHGVSANWYNVKPCPYDQVSSLISTCDSMCLFSVLESFSNNFVESWRMQKPLVAADYDWSRAITGDGALLVDPENPSATGERLVELINNPEQIKKLVDQGAAQLSGYPTTIEKCKMYLQRLEDARQLGRLGKKQRSGIEQWSCK